MEKATNTKVSDKYDFEIYIEKKYLINKTNNSSRSFSDCEPKYGIDT